MSDRGFHIDCFIQFATILGHLFLSTGNEQQKVLKNIVSSRCRPYFRRRLRVVSITDAGISVCGVTKSVLRRGPRQRSFRLPMTQPQTREARAGVKARPSPDLRLNSASPSDRYCGACQSRRVYLSLDPAPACRRPKNPRIALGDSHINVGPLVALIMA